MTLCLVTQITDAPLRVLGRAKTDGSTDRITWIDGPNSELSVRRSPWFQEQCAQLQIRTSVVVANRVRFATEFGRNRLPESLLQAECGNARLRRQRLPPARVLSVNPFCGFTQYGAWDSPGAQARGKYQQREVAEHR